MLSMWQKQTKMETANKLLISVFFLIILLSACAAKPSSAVEALQDIESEMRKMREETSVLNNRIKELEVRLDSLSANIDNQTEEIKETGKSITETKKDIEALR